MYQKDTVVGGVFGRHPSFNAFTAGETESKKFEIVANIYSMAPPSYRCLTVFTRSSKHSVKEHPVHLDMCRFMHDYIYLPTVGLEQYKIACYPNGSGAYRGQRGQKAQEAAMIEIKNGSRNGMMVDAMMVGMILSMLKSGMATGQTMMMTAGGIASKKIAKGMMKMSGKAARVLQETQPGLQRSTVQNRWMCIMRIVPGRKRPECSWNWLWYMRKHMALRQLMSSEFRRWQKGTGNHYGRRQQVLWQELWQVPTCWQCFGQMKAKQRLPDRQELTRTFSSTTTAFHEFLRVGKKKYHRPIPHRDAKREEKQEKVLGFAMFLEGTPKNSEFILLPSRARREEVYWLIQEQTSSRQDRDKT